MTIFAMTTISSIWSSLLSLFIPASKVQAESCLHWSEIGLIVMSVVVAIGVYGESRKQWVLWHFLFEGLVFFGVTGEFIEDALVWRSTEKLQSIDDAELSAAQNQAATAIKAVADLGVAFDKLPAIVDAKKKELDDAIRDFRGFADTNKRELAALSKKETDLAKIIGDAQKDEDALRASADTIKDLRQQLMDLADRTIDVRRVAKRIEAFSKTPVVLAFSDDQDSLRLTFLISQALGLAQWDLKTNGPSNGGAEFTSRLFGKVMARSLPSLGISVMYAPIDRASLQGAAEALANALTQEQIKRVGHGELTPEQIRRQLLITGVIHVFVGSKN